MALLAATTRLLLYLLLPPHCMQSAYAQKPLELAVWTWSSSWSGITVVVRPYMASQRLCPVGCGPEKLEMLKLLLCTGDRLVLSLATQLEVGCLVVASSFKLGGKA